ncbi:MAG: hypothetical protein HN576_12940 [Bacteriovoracaceae bacterium]|jgi:hypothetical protein|nr:hypothetical protein [Bacteriovoracaceae bacterium]
MHQSTIDKSSHALKYVPNYPTKTCPKCDSIFVTTKECESCGFQMNLNLIGEPLDRKSFYSLQEKYVKDFKKTYFTSTRNKLKEEYKRAIWHRFDILLGFFPDPENEQFSFFSIELKDLVEELLVFGINADQLKFKCSQSEVPALKKYIAAIMFEWETNYPKYKYPRLKEFLGLHSSNIRAWFVVYITLICLGYIAKGN